MTGEPSCVIYKKNEFITETNSGLGGIIKISEGMTTLRAALIERQVGMFPQIQSEFIYL